MKDQHGATLQHPSGLTVLVTGASGFLRHGLLSRLRGRMAPGAAIRGVIDGCQPYAGRGWPASVREGIGGRPPVQACGDDLAHTVDAVVHLSSASALLPDPDRAARLTRHVLEFADRAGAPLYYVGSAFSPLAAREPGIRTRDDVAEEEMILGSGLPHVVIRPSIVIGDGTTAMTSVLPGIYEIFDAIIGARFERLPVNPDYFLDLIPSGTVADVIVALVEHRVTDGEYWLTNGEHALTVGQIRDLIVESAREIGVDIGQLACETAPVGDRGQDRPFLTGISSVQRRKVLMLIDLLVRTAIQDEPLETSLGDRFETSIGELGAMGVPALLEQRSTLRTGLRAWFDIVGPPVGRSVVA